MNIPRPAAGSNHVKLGLLHTSLGNLSNISFTNSIGVDISAKFDLFDSIIDT